MSIPDRFARIARHKFNEIKDRIDQWDTEAEERADAKTRRQSDAKSEAGRASRELDDSLTEPRAFPKENGESGASRPAPRTPAEIARGVGNPNREPLNSPASGSGPLGKTLANGSSGGAGGNGGNNGAGTQEGDASLDYHYRLLGVEPGDDFGAVQESYKKLAARCEPSRFPAGSKEAQDVEAIRKKLDASFEILRDALDVTARRFGLLDFDDAPVNGAAPPTSSLEL